MKRISKLNLKLILSSLSIVTISTLVLCMTTTYADTGNSNGSTVTVTVNSACTMKGGSDGTSTSDSVYSATIDPGTTEVINGSKLVTVCNDTNGYSIYAIGYSGNSTDSPTNTQMLSSLGSGNINTNTTGDASYWAMKLSAVSGITPPTILNSFDNYHVIPADYTQIAKYTSTTESGTATGAAVQTSYQVHINSAQVAATYTGKVKYTMVHPNTEIPPTKPMTLDAIAADTSHTHYMQDSIDCLNSTVGTKVTLTDSRDGQTYQVAKANDNQCWMIENLKLGKTLTAGQTLMLTTINSNVNSNYSISYSDIPADGKFHAYTIDGVINQNNSNEWICRDDWDSCYYNWYTATAGAGTTYKTTGTVDTSICPAGWTLPTGGSRGQFQDLYNQYNSAALMLVDNPTTTKNNFMGKIPGFLLSGYYQINGVGSLGSYGQYWSRNANSAQHATFLLIHTSGFGPVNIDNKYLGFAVRCILR